MNETSCSSSVRQYFGSLHSQSSKSSAFGTAFQNSRSAALQRGRFPCWTSSTLCTMPRAENCAFDRTPREVGYFHNQAGPENHLTRFSNGSPCRPERWNQVKICQRTTKIKWGIRPISSLGFECCGRPLPLLRRQTRFESARGLAQSNTWRRDGRFMESLHSLLRMHGDHEPFPARSNRREWAQTFLMESERTHVRCYEVHGEPPFAFAHAWGP